MSMSGSDSVGYELGSFKIEIEPFLIFIICTDSNQNFSRSESSDQAEKIGSVCSFSFYSIHRYIRASPEWDAKK